MFQLLLGLIIIIIVISVALQHNNNKRMILNTKKVDIDILKNAAQRSIAASNTVNPILALVDVSKGIQSIEDLHIRYGQTNASDFCKFDTVEMLDILKQQQERIIQDIIKQYPSVMTPHPLNKVVGLQLTEQEA